MKIRILKAHSLGGGRDCQVGDVVEVDPNAAKYKVEVRNIAEYVDEEEPLHTAKPFRKPSTAPGATSPLSAAGTVATRDPRAVNRDPKTEK